MPVVEGVLAVRLQREHRGDPIAAEHRHPDERLRHPSVVGRRTGDEDCGALGDRPDLALQLLALEGARPGRLPHQHRLAGFVRLAGRSGHRQGNRRHDLLHPADVLVTLGHRAFGGLGDGGKDETVERQVDRELLAQRAHDRPAVQAGRKPPPDRVDDFEAAALILDRLVAAGVAEGERHLVADQLQERRGGVFIGIGPGAPDAKSTAPDPAFFQGDPQRRRRLVGDHGPVSGHGVTRDGDQRRAGRQPPRARDGVALHAQVARPVGAILQGDHLERVDGQQLAEGCVKTRENARLVEGRRHRSRDAVQGLEPASLVSRQLVERGVGEQDAEAPVHLFEEGELGRGHASLPRRVIDDASDQLALVHDRDPDRHLAAYPHAGPGARQLAERGERKHCGLGVGELAGERRLADEPAAHVLQHAGVDRQRVIPALPLENLQVDGDVVEPRPESAVEDLDEVGLGDARAELLDQRSGGRAYRLAHDARPDAGRGQRQGSIYRRRRAVGTSVTPSWGSHCHGYTAPRVGRFGIPQHRRYLGGRSQGDGGAVPRASTRASAPFSAAH